MNFFFNQTKKTQVLTAPNMPLLPRRVMHYRDGLLDGHIGPEFLERLQVNGREPMEFWSMAGHLGVLLQQVSSVGLLWVTYAALLESAPVGAAGAGVGAGGTVRGALGGLTVLLVVLRCITASPPAPSPLPFPSPTTSTATPDTHPPTVVLSPGGGATKDHDAPTTVGHSVGYLVVLAAVAPPIVNMTTTVSTTAIHRLAVVGLLGYLTFHDYGVHHGSAAPTAGLNWGVFAAVCLASKLPAPEHALVLVRHSTKCIPFPFPPYVP
jgi:hypothetical protein